MPEGRILSEDILHIVSAMTGSIRLLCSKIVR